MTVFSFILGIFMTIGFLLIIGMYGKYCEQQSKQIQKVIDLLEKIHEVLKKEVSHD